jgi:hypothetical protein
MEEKEEKLIVSGHRLRPPAEPYLTVQNADLAVELDQKVVAARGRLLGERVSDVQVLRRQLQDVVVVDKHALGRLALVLARAIVVALVVVQLVGLRTRTLAGERNVLRTLSRSQDASASVERGGRTNRDVNSHESERKTKTNLPTSNHTQTSNKLDKQDRYLQWLKQLRQNLPMGEAFSSLHSTVQFWQFSDESFEAPLDDDDDDE